MTRETYKHQPDNPYADEFGFVTLDNYYQYKYLTEEDKGAIIGNQRVNINFISDSMEPTWHPVDNRYYTSKKKFRNETKARGCVEIGNDIKVKPRKPVKLDRKQRREDIKKAIYDIRNGHNTFKDTPNENHFKKS